MSRIVILSILTMAIADSKIAGVPAVLKFQVSWNCPEIWNCLEILLIYQECHESAFDKQ